MATIITPDPDLYSTGKLALFAFLISCIIRSLVK